MQFQISSRRENNRKRDTVFKIKVLRKVFSNNFALSDAEDNTSGLSNRGRMPDLTLFRTLLAIHQKSQEPNFWEVMDCFVLLASAILAVSRTLLQQLLAYLNFTLQSEDLSFWYKKKKISMTYGSSTRS